jgi:hypothetical protein
VNSGEEISGEFVVAGGDSSKVLEFIEEALDKIAFAVEREIAISLGAAAGRRRDNRSDSALGQGVDKPISVEGLVADQGIGIGGFNERLGAGQIVGLTWREHQLDGIAQSIDERVDFGGQSAAGSADRLLAVFFRAPALCW